MENVYTLTFYDNLEGYLEGFFIEVFASYDAAEQIAQRYLNHVSGFKDYPCQYEIKTKKVIGKANTTKDVCMITGWNINNDIDEVDIWESDLYVDKHETVAALKIVQGEIKRQEWCIDTYKIGACLWQEGFVRA